MSWAHVVIPIFCSSCHMRLLLSPPTCHNILHINWRNHFQHVILFTYDRLKYENLWHNLVSNTTITFFTTPISIQLAVETSHHTLLPFFASHNNSFQTHGRHGWRGVGKNVAESNGVDDGQDHQTGGFGAIAQDPGSRVFVSINSLREYLRGVKIMVTQMNRSKVW